MRGNGGIEESVLSPELRVYLSSKEELIGFCAPHHQ